MHPLIVNLKPLHIKKLATYVHRTSARSTLLVFLLSRRSVCSAALGRSVVSLKSPMAFLLGSLWWPSWRLELPGLHRSVLTVSSLLWVWRLASLCCSPLPGSNCGAASGTGLLLSMISGKSSVCGGEPVCVCVCFICVWLCVCVCVLVSLGMWFIVVFLMCLVLCYIYFVYSSLIWCDDFFLQDQPNAL